MTTKTVRCSNLIDHGRWHSRCSRDAGDGVDRHGRPACNICAAAFRRGEAKREINDKARRERSTAQYAAAEERRRVAKELPEQLAAVTEERDALREAAQDVVDAHEGWDRGASVYEGDFVRVYKALKALLSNAD